MESEGRSEICRLPALFHTVDDLNQHAQEERLLYSAHEDLSMTSTLSWCDTNDSHEERSQQPTGDLDSPHLNPDPNIEPLCELTLLLPEPLQLLHQIFFLLHPDLSLLLQLLPLLQNLNTQNKQSGGLIWWHLVYLQSSSVVVGLQQRCLWRVGFVPEGAEWRSNLLFLTLVVLLLRHSPVIVADFSLLSVPNTTLHQTWGHQQWHHQTPSFISCLFSLNSIEAQKASEGGIFL